MAQSDEACAARPRPARHVFGEGAIGRLGQELETLGARRVLVVTGVASLRRSEAYPRIRRTLGGFAATLIPAASNPTVASIEHARRSLAGAGFDAAVGIGGGSAIDTAKGLAFFLPRPGPVAPLTPDAPGDGVASLPVVAVPTTAGSGSEATPYCSLTTTDRRKVSLEHPDLLPRLALVDPALTHALPPYVTAYSGFDALCQAVESAWSVRSSPGSEAHALRAAALVMGHLGRAVRDPGDAPARAAMARASLEAGAAIARTRTTAVHAASYPLTALYGIPHGHACALTLAPFLRFNAPALDGPRAGRLWAALGAPDADAAAAAVERLMADVGLEPRLSRLGVDRPGLDALVARGFRPDRVHNNPRAVTPDDLRGILEGVY